MVALDRQLPIRLVPADEVDRAAAVALINAAFRRYNILHVDRTSPEQFAAELGDTGELLVFERGTRLVASALIRSARELYPDPAANPFSVSVHDALYFGLAAVDPLEMNSGFGRRLTAEAERLAAERGFALVALSTVREFGLVDYYARRGYIMTAFEDHPAGHWGIVVPHRVAYMVKTP
ncbi:MAG: hypothetical protein IT429_23100 [Gemmataceae bacterium]|nr:hypothetical protein [Gemmataceae bacterium]